MEIFKERELTDKHGNTVLADEVLAKIKIILLYFGSEWSDSTTNILPKLMEMHTICRNRDFELEVIFISSDTDVTTMRKYFQTHGDWYAVIYDDIFAHELRWAYMVYQLPFVVAIDRDGCSVAQNAYQEIMDYGKNVLIKWF